MCSSKPCPQNVICVNGFTNQRYICLMCKAGFMGERCEQGKKRTLFFGI